MKWSIPAWTSWRVRTRSCLHRGQRFIHTKRKEEKKDKVKYESPRAAEVDGTVFAQVHKEVVMVETMEHAAQTDPRVLEARCEEVNADRLRMKGAAAHDDNDDLLEASRRRAGSKNSADV